MALITPAKSSRCQCFGHPQQRKVYPNARQQFEEPTHLQPPRHHCTNSRSKADRPGL